MDERRRGDGWWVTTFVIGIVALVMGVVAIALASNDDNAGSAAGAGGGSGNGGAATANGGQVEFDVMLADISVMPNSIEVPAGALITLHVTNNGQLDHDLKVEGGDAGTTRLKSGESQDVEVGPFTADSAIWCTVAGHKEAGMNIAVHVVGGSSSSAGGTATTAPADQSAQILSLIHI